MIVFGDTKSAQLVVSVRTNTHVLHRKTESDQLRNGPPCVIISEIEVIEKMYILYTRKNKPLPNINLSQI